MSEQAKDQAVLNHMPEVLLSLPRLCRITCFAGSE